MNLNNAQGLFDREHLIFPPRVHACGGNFTSSSVSFKPSDFIFLHAGEMYPNIFLWVDLHVDSTSKGQGQTYTLGKGRRLPWAPKSQGPPKMLFKCEIRIKRRHASGCLLCLLPWRPSACPSWMCFLCILLVANENIIDLKLTPPPSLSLYLCVRREAERSCAFS